MTKWAVVQDLRPFGYRIESVTRFKSKAELQASLSRYLEVLPYDFVIAENKRLDDISEFNKELKEHIKKRIL